MPLDSAPVLNCRGWIALDWGGCEIAILASGESLSVEQCEAVRAWRDLEPGRKVIAINTTFRRALWADVLYACDLAWWEGRDRTDMRTYLEEARATFNGAFWTQDEAAAKKHGLCHIRSRVGKGICREPGVIFQGAAGGYQAVGLAWQAGAHAVYLLGYDMRGGHWHGHHPAMLHKNNPFHVWLTNFAGMAADVAAMDDFTVINCTPNSAMRAFPVKPWQEVFA